NSKHLAVFFFSFVVLLRLNVFICTGEMLLLGLFFLLCASKTRECYQGKRKTQLPNSWQGCGPGHQLYVCCGHGSCRPPVGRGLICSTKELVVGFNAYRLTIQWLLRRGSKRWRCRAFLHKQPSARPS